MCNFCRSPDDSLWLCQMLSWFFSGKLAACQQAGCFETVRSWLVGSQAFILLQASLMRLPNKVKSFFDLCWCKLKQRSRLQGKEFPVIGAVIWISSNAEKQSNSLWICTTNFLMDAFFSSKRRWGSRVALFTCSCFPVCCWCGSYRVWGG